MNKEDIVRVVTGKFQALSPVMDERMRRLWAGAEVLALGRGGIAAVAKATGMSRTTIRAGRDELLDEPDGADVVSERRPGGGRPRLEEAEPELLGALESLVEPVTRGDPESPLRWTSKSTRKLATELRAQGYELSPQKVGELLHELGYSLQSTWQWWWRMGRKKYAGATEILVTADGGGSNASRSRQWKTELQGFSDRTGLTVAVSHFPPGTSKWNKIEHRLFCHITENWRGRPLVDLETVVQLIGATRTTKGLHVKAKLDTRSYPIGIRITDAELEDVELEPDAFHGEWNYKIYPRESVK